MFGLCVSHTYSSMFIGQDSGTTAVQQKRPKANGEQKTHAQNRNSNTQEVGYPVILVLLQEVLHAKPATPWLG